MPEKVNEDESSCIIKITLPWPPSVNHYWRRNGNRYFVSKEGNDYRDNVNCMTSNLKLIFDKKDKLSIIVMAYPPDRRRRDLDNILKSLLGSLQYAQVYFDDNQIDRIYVERCLPLKAQVVITLYKLGHQGIPASSTSVS